MKLGVASVALANIHPRVALGLSSNLFYLGKKMPELEVVEVLPARFEISTARNLCADIAIKEGCDYFFWLDDDTVLTSKTTLWQLLTDLVDNPDIYMIGPAYYIRSYPYKLMAFKPVNDATMKLLEAGEEAEMIDDDGLVRNLRAIGNGCTMMRMEVFTKMTNAQANREWYRTGKKHTEDAYFCAKARSVIPEFQCAIDMKVTASHLMGTDSVDKDNVRYKRLKYELCCGLRDDPTRIHELEKMIERWELNDLSLEKTPLGLDDSLGRM